MYDRDMTLIELVWNVVYLNCMYIGIPQRFVLAYDWLHFVVQNHFYVMLLSNQGYRLI
jgi:hypothetical protein